MSIVVDNIENRIRSKLGVSEPYLTDAEINFPDVVDVAELNVVSLFPDCDEFDGDYRIYLESILVLECCILLCPSMSARLPKKETGPHAGHELWINWDSKKLEFIVERDSLIGRLDGLIYPNDGFKGFKGFEVTRPIRKW